MAAATLARRANGWLWCAASDWAGPEERTLPPLLHTHSLTCASYHHRGLAGHGARDSQGDGDVDEGRLALPRVPRRRAGCWRLHTRNRKFPGSSITVVISAAPLPSLYTLVSKLTMQSPKFKKSSARGARTRARRARRARAESLAERDRRRSRTTRPDSTIVVRPCLKSTDYSN